jgi:hypothetical protein
VATIAAMTACTATMAVTQPVQPVAFQTNPTRNAPALPPM